VDTNSEQHKKPDLDEPIEGSEFALEDIMEIITEMGRVWRALGHVTYILAKRGIGYKTTWNAYKGEFTIKFFKEK